MPQYCSYLLYALSRQGPSRIWSSCIPSAYNSWNTAHAQKILAESMTEQSITSLNHKVSHCNIYFISWIYIFRNLFQKFLGKYSREQTLLQKYYTNYFSLPQRLHPFLFASSFPITSQPSTLHPLIITVGDVTLKSSWLLIYFFHSPHQQTQHAVYVWNSCLHGNFTQYI